jgi:hypothetical protein
MPWPGAPGSCDAGTGDSEERAGEAYRVGALDERWRHVEDSGSGQGRRGLASAGVRRWKAADLKRST